jgi:hypothetical protein
VPLIAFFLIANPMTYKVTRGLSSAIASTDGLPSQAGVFLHAIVFVAVVKFLMRLLRRRKSKYTPGISSMAWITNDQVGSMRATRKK